MKGKERKGEKGKENEEGGKGKGQRKGEGKVCNSSSEIIIPFILTIGEV